MQFPSRQLYSYYECDKWRRDVRTPKTEAGIRSLIITPEILPTLEEFLPTNEVVGRSRKALEQRIDGIRQRSGLLGPLPESDISQSWQNRI